MENENDIFSLENINEKNIKIATDFIKKFEKMAVGLSSQFVEALKFLKLGRLLSAKRIMNNLFIVYKNKKIFGLFSVTAFGTFYHCFPALWQNNFQIEKNNENEDFFENYNFVAEKYFFPLKSLIKPILEQNQIYGMIGEAKSTSLFAKIFEKTPACQRKYFFMEQLNEPSETEFLDEKLKNAVQFCKCTSKDKEKLYILQKGYEIEEVLPPFSEHNKESCLKNFEVSLKKQQIFAIFFAGLPIAKTGTNAQGFNYCQIGGVYTLPNYRSKGLAGFGIYKLCSILKAQNKTPVLFVKTHNIQAQKAYLKAGFIFTGKFNIFYF